MDIDKIIKDLKIRFQTELPEFYKRRIIFWIDNDREFEDKFDDIILDNVMIIKLEDNNKFETKRILAFENTDMDFLVYCTANFEDKEDNWLIDVMRYSEEFRADLISIWINEMGVENISDIRREIKKYNKFFKNSSNRKSVKDFSPFDRKTLNLAVMASIVGSKNNPTSIMRQAIIKGDEVLEKLTKYGADEVFWNMVNKGTGYYENDMSVKGLLRHIILTCLNKTIDKKEFLGLERYISQTHNSYCYDFVSEWVDSGDRAYFYDLAREIEEEFSLFERLSKVDMSKLLINESIPCIEEVILDNFMHKILNDSIDVDLIKTTVEGKKTSVWKEEFIVYYQAIDEIANMQSFYLKYKMGFHDATPIKSFNNYIKYYHIMDTYYRRFHESFSESLKGNNVRLDDLLKSCVDVCEGLYKEWFLRLLSENWTNVVSEDFEKLGYISEQSDYEKFEISRQKDFYNKYVLGNKSKTFVIISDAMRYEVANELKDILSLNQSKVEIEAMQGIFPTITEYGMAALLPHQKLSIDDRGGDILNILADGIPTDSQNREKILKEKNNKSVVIKYDFFIGLKRAQRSDITKGQEVVYIYHDTIDKAGHNSDDVFSACRLAVGEISNLVKILVNDCNATNIYITSDHGFLYTYKPLGDYDKVSKKNFEGKDIYSSRRYVIMKDDAQPESLLPVKLLDGNTGYLGFTPRENIRLKVSGSKGNFVHGGISLQEMVIPVICYKHIRTDSKEYRDNKEKYDTKPVELKVLSSVKKISNMIFSLDFYQSDAISENRIPVNYEIYFIDEYDNKVSHVQRIFADKNNKDSSERIFRLNFNLKSIHFDRTRKYYLVIIDEDRKVPPVKEQFDIDIAFSSDGFDFF